MLTTILTGRSDMKCAVLCTHKSVFFRESPPHLHRGWTLEALRDYCREEMTIAGFDLNRRIFCAYDFDSGNVIL
jgi:hypothetical protein